MRLEVMMPKTLNGIANLTSFAGIIVLTVAGVWASFLQGWSGPEIVAVNGAIILAWGLFLGWIAYIAKTYKF